MMKVLKFGSQEIEFDEDVTEIQQLVDSLLIITKLNSSFILEKRIGNRWMLLFEFGHIKLALNQKGAIFKGAANVPNAINGKIDRKIIMSIEELKSILNFFLFI